MTRFRAVCLIRDAKALPRSTSHSYFSIPGETTLVELADELGSSDHAVNERMCQHVAA